jgi:hypothetical protein
LPSFYKLSFTACFNLTFKKNDERNQNTLPPTTPNEPYLPTTLLPSSEMGRLVKLVGGGIGLAHEAIAARRVKSHNPVIVDADEGEFGSGVFNPAASSAFLEKHKAAVAHEEHSDPCDGDSADYDSADYDERLRVLDEAQGEHVLSSGFQHNSKTKNHAQTMDVDTFAAENPPPSYPYSRSSTNGGVPRLINPVIIPQRRPHDKTRGFIRAYAPVLQDFGIAPATFLAFLKEFHKRSQVRGLVLSFYHRCISPSSLHSPY